ncbi:MAG: hypothetical protein CBB71_05895 [Rhodopirellula sp. TMED11]|nr:MAG: hypothetical protein CBB71_05895 [Rhodopirellula sp. TMED11]
MTHWILNRKSNEAVQIDARNLTRRRLREQLESGAGQIMLHADGAPVLLDELFDVQLQPSAVDRIEVHGHLQGVDALASYHDQGEFLIHGDTGNHVAAGLQGGRVVVHGSVGDSLGGPAPGAKAGMVGGVIQVDGSAGDYCGHRMRRGLIQVNQNVGRNLAASMIAGTLLVQGELDAPSIAVGMRRGTIVLTRPLEALNQPSSAQHLAARLSTAVSFDAGFLKLMEFTVERAPIERLIQSPLRRCRADRSVGGLGEVIFSANDPV